MSIKQFFFVSLVIVFISLVSMNIACFGADADPCKDLGITVKNLTFKEIWYQRQDGSCTTLKRNYFFSIKPEEEVRLFSDMVCETLYCPACKYSDYKSYDANGDCRVRILPGGTLSDM